MKNRIEQTLGNCKFQHVCECIEKNSFETNSTETFYILDEKDNEQPVRIVTALDNYQLTVNNFSAKEISLLKTDNCLLTDDTQKCDCILFDNQKLFFVEIKTSSTGSRGSKRKSAREQLGITIDLFKQNSIDISQYQTTAIICFKSIEPRIVNSARDTARAEFWGNHHINLEEKNVIEF